VSITPDRVASMSSDIQSLWRLLDSVRAEVDSQNFVDVSYARVAQLDAQRVQVFTGQRSYETWKRDVEEERRVLASTIEDEAASSFGNVLWNTATAIGEQLADGASDVAAAASSGPLWGLVVVALGFVVYMKVAR
jgi:hypothetical protein